MKTLFMMTAGLVVIIGCNDSPRSERSRKKNTSPKRSSQYLVRPRTLMDKAIKAGGHIDFTDAAIRKPKSKPVKSESTSGISKSDACS